MLMNPMVHVCTITLQTMAMAMNNVNESNGTCLYYNAADYGYGYE